MPADRRRRRSAAGAVGLVLLTFAATAAGQGADPRTEMSRTVLDQLAAFRRDDWVAAYGYADHDATALPYTQSSGLECVDDPASPHYNQIVDGSARDWSSSEQMRRDDVLYTHVIELDHNASHTPRRGSCIFLHVWSGPDSTTSGCTAMAQYKLEALLRVVDRDTTYVLLPRAEYDRVATQLDLPR